MTYKKIFFKYILIFLLAVFVVNSIFFISQQSIRKILESDRFFSFMMRNVMLNVDKLSTYKPTAEEKKKLITEFGLQTGDDASLELAIQIALDHLQMLEDALYNAGIEVGMGQLRGIVMDALDDPTSGY